MIAQPAANLRLNGERRSHLLNGDQLSLDQQIAQSHSCFNNALR
jgi:hypothetical protein